MHFLPKNVVTLQGDVINYDSKQTKTNMKHTLLTFLAALLFASVANTQERKFMLHAVAFYNLENLFDTCHDAHKNDYDFLPDGSYLENTQLEPDIKVLNDPAEVVKGIDEQLIIATRELLKEIK